MPNGRQKLSHFLIHDLRPQMLNGHRKLSHLLNHDLMKHASRWLKRWHYRGLKQQMPNGRTLKHGQRLSRGCRGPFQHRSIFWRW
jgi:hypothetical protein